MGKKQAEQVAIEATRSASFCAEWCAIPYRYSTSSISTDFAGRLMERTPLLSSGDVRLAAQLLAEVEELVRTEVVVLRNAAPVGI